MKQMKELKDIKTIHFVGIGGAGMSPLAKIMAEHKAAKNGDTQETDSKEA